MQLFEKYYNQDCISGAIEHLDDGSVDLIITDPPYGINGDTLHRHYNRDESYVVDGYVEIPKSEYPDFSSQWITEAERVLRPGGSLYIVSGYTNLIHILNALKTTNLQEQNHIIWKYNFGVYTSQKFVSSHYHLLYYVKPPRKKVTFNTYSRFGSRDKTDHGRSCLYADLEDVWEINREYKPGRQKNKNELPTELLAKIIQYSSNPKEVVADFFLGGFSTAKVAKGLRRSVVGFEINSNGFHHHRKEAERLELGWLEGDVPRGVNDSPKNQGKQWTALEKERFEERYSALSKKLQTKQAVIDHLQKEFGRGYWAVQRMLNLLDL